MANFIPEEKIAGWFEKYGYIYTFTYQDEVYFFHALSRRHYKLALLVEDESERNEEICETCILWPEGWKADSPEVQNGPACIPDTIANEILRCSGYVNSVEVFKQARPIIDASFELQMEAMVEYVFGGGGNFAKYQEWSNAQLMDAWARAYWVLEFILKVEHIELQIKDQTETSSKPAGAARKPMTPQEKAQWRKDAKERLDAARAGMQTGLDSGEYIKTEASNVKPGQMPLSQFEALQRKTQILQMAKDLNKK